MNMLTNSVAEANRAKYSTAQEAKDAIWAKYTSTREYSAYSLEEREAMARNEVEMTLFGIIDTWNNDPHLKGTVSKNTLDSTNEAESRSFNVKTLGAQFLNLWKNNGIDASQMNGSGFLFSVNGMNGQASVYLMDGRKQDASFLDLLTKALNTKDNASNLFSNLLYDAMKYSIFEVPDLVLSMEYRNGEVYMNGDKPHVDLRA